MAQIESLENNETKAEPNKSKPEKRKHKSIQPEAPAEEERLTAEEWEERLKAEEAKAAKTEQPKTLTKEEFLAEMKEKAGGQQKPVAGFISRLQANMDEALGVTPKSIAAGAANSGSQGIEAGRLQVIGREGAFSTMQRNPLVSGIIAMAGLLVMLIGTFSHTLGAALITELMGLIIFAAGLVLIIKYLLKK
ncbi:MAG: hypothetical protein QXN16_00590 [Candidatus Micrarchaeaceae archaeon]